MRGRLLEMFLHARRRTCGALRQRVGVRSLSACSLTNGAHLIGLQESLAREAFKTQDDDFVTVAGGTTERYRITEARGTPEISVDGPGT